MSQAYQIHVLDPSHSHTSPTLLNNLTLNTLPIPVPGPGEVLVRIRAAAVNYRDILVVADSPLYTARTSAGLTPCADGAGTIEAVGPNSTWSDSIGEGVLLVNNTDWIDGDVEGYKVHHTLGCGGVHGTLRQYAVVSDEFVVRKPKNLGFEEAAAMVSAGGTAMNALLAGGVGPGKTLLTQGTGGVSCFAILVSTVAVALVGHFTHVNRGSMLLLWVPESLRLRPQMRSSRVPKSSVHRKSLTTRRPPNGQSRHCH